MAANELEEHEPETLERVVLDEIAEFSHYRASEHSANVREDVDLEAILREITREEEGRSEPDARFRGADLGRLIRSIREFDSAAYERLEVLRSQWLEGNPLLSEYVGDAGPEFADRLLRAVAGLLLGLELTMPDAAVDEDSPVFVIDTASWRGHWSATPAEEHDVGRMLRAATRNTGFSARAAEAIAGRLAELLRDGSEDWLFERLAIARRGNCLELGFRLPEMAGDAQAPLPTTSAAGEHALAQLPSEAEQEVAERFPGLYDLLSELLCVLLEVRASGLAQGNALTRSLERLRRAAGAPGVEACVCGFVGEIADAVEAEAPAERVILAAETRQQQTRPVRFPMGEAELTVYKAFDGVPILEFDPAAPGLDAVRIGEHEYPSVDPNEDGLFRLASPPGVKPSGPLAVRIGGEWFPVGQIEIE